MKIPKTTDIIKLREFMTQEELAEFDRLITDPAANIRRYRTDPVAFVREVLKAIPTPYQERILMALVKYHRVAVRGPRGLGKTTVGAWAVLWFIGTRSVCKIPTIASIWRQLIEFFWPEIHYWAERADWSKVGVIIRREKELFNQRLAINPNRTAFPLSSSDPERIEGAHSPSILIIFDESKLIPVGLWDSAEGALTSEDAFALALSTPGDSVGRFYDIHMRKPGLEEWHPIHVTLQEAIDAGRVPAAWARQRAIVWGETSAIYKRQVLGEFAEEEAEVVITLGMIEAAQERWRDYEYQVRQAIADGMSEHEAIRMVWGVVTDVGCDPARFGTDKTALALGYGAKGIRTLLRFEKQDTMETAGRVAAVIEPTNAIAKIDVNGLGAGVYDRLRELDYEVTPIQTSARVVLRDRTGQLRFRRYRDWLYWNVRDELSDPESEFALPPDDLMQQDMTAAKYTYDSEGRIVVISKDEMRPILGRSPDAGEAVMYTMAPEERPYKPLVGII